VSGAGIVLDFRDRKAEAWRVETGVSPQVVQRILQSDGGLTCLLFNLFWDI
jgi:hypothetical protein